ncbi:hypothetical protein F5Y05DRAFT_415220 [Hypoxylon sp. FL0543]|nr:hypothetical protein F5Y05DRAFT_415220 [Hypoxylon sp. FL0543]
MSSQGWPRPRKEANRNMPHTSYEGEANTERTKQRIDARVQTTPGQLARLRKENPPMLDSNGNSYNSQRRLASESLHGATEIPPPVPPKDPQNTRSLNYPAAIRNRQEPPRREPRGDERLTSTTHRSVEVTPSGGGGTQMPQMIKVSIMVICQVVMRLSPTQSAHPRKPATSTNELAIITYEKGVELPRDDGSITVKTVARASAALLTSSHTGSLHLYPPTAPPAPPSDPRQPQNDGAGLPAGPVPPRPRTAKGYARRPFDEPAPQSVVDDLRNAWQGIQRPVKVHAMPVERVSRRPRSKSQDRR